MTTILDEVKGSHDTGPQPHATAIENRENGHHEYRKELGLPGARLDAEILREPDRQQRNGSRGRYQSVSQPV